MKYLNKALLSTVVLIVFSITGCATNAEKNFLSKNNITIERVHSKNVHVEKADVIKTANGIRVYGYLKRHAKPRGTIPGHIDVEIINSNGESQGITRDSYSRTNRRKQVKFSVVLNAVPENGSIIRVTHHPK